MRIVSFIAPMLLFGLSIYYSNIFAAIASLILLYVIKIYDVAESIADEMHVMNHFILDVLSSEHDIDIDMNFDTDDDEEFDSDEDEALQNEPEKIIPPAKVMLDDADETTWQKLMQSIKNKDDEGR